MEPVSKAPYPRTLKAWVRENSEEIRPKLHDPELDRQYEKLWEEREDIRRRKRNIEENLPPEDEPWNRYWNLADSPWKAFQVLESRKEVEEPAALSPWSRMVAGSPYRKETTESGAPLRIPDETAIRSTHKLTSDDVVLYQGRAGWWTTNRDLAISAAKEEGGSGVIKISSKKLLPEGTLIDLNGKPTVIRKYFGEAPGSNPVLEEFSAY